MSMEYIRRTYNVPAKRGKRVRYIVGIEIDPVYFDTACRRIEQAVKKQECKLPGFSAKAKAVQVALPL